jgi:hypothetical protein
VADSSLLQQLKDIHLPRPVGFWPPALGWWIVLFVLPLSVFAFYSLRKPYQAFLIKKQLMQHLSEIELAYRNGESAILSMQKLTNLLKKAALMSYPREQVASLYGADWVHFLQASIPQYDASRVMVLIQQSLYQPEINEDISDLFVFARHWLRKQRILCMN